VTEPIESALAAPDAVIDTVEGGSAEPLASPELPDLGNPARPHGVEETHEPRLQAFDEMLPAARAFYRRSSKR
jgi:hypothetical protein